LLDELPLIDLVGCGARRGGWPAGAFGAEGLPASLAGACPLPLTFVKGWVAKGSNDLRMVGLDMVWNGKVKRGKAGGLFVNKVGGFSF